MRASRKIQRFIATSGKAGLYSLRQASPEEFHLPNQAGRPTRRGTRRTNPAAPVSPLPPSPNTSDAPADSSTRPAMASLTRRSVDTEADAGTTETFAPSARNTTPTGPSPSSSITRPPVACDSIIDATKYCKASRSRDSGTGTVAAHVPISRNRTPRTIAIDAALQSRSELPVPIECREPPDRIAQRPDTPASAESCQ